MFLYLFRSSFVTQYVIIGIIGLVLWIPAFITPPPLPGPGQFAPLYQIIFELLSDHPAVASVTGFLLALLSSFLFSHILNNNGLAVKNASLPGLLYILFLSYFFPLLTLHPLLIVQFFLLLILKTLFDAFNRSEPYDYYYTAGFISGFASFFYFPFSFALLYLVVIFIIFRSSTWREWAASLIGYITPFLFLSVWYFWFDRLEDKTHEYLRSFSIYPDFSGLDDRWFVVLTAVFLFIFLFSALYSLGKLKEKTIEIRRKSLAMNWSVLLLLVSLPFSGTFSRYHFILMVPVTAWLFSSYLLSLKKSFWQELFLLAFFLLILAGNYLSLFTH